MATCGSPKRQRQYRHRPGQEAPEGPASLLETVLEGDPERLTLLREADSADPLRLAEIHERLRAIGARIAAPARAATILAGLPDFDEAAQARPVSSFSGGWPRCVWRWPPPSSPTPTCCCSMSRPTISIWKPGCGSRVGSRAFPGRHWWCRMTAACSTALVEAIAHLDRGKISLTPGGFEEFRCASARSEDLATVRAAERIAVERAHIQSPASSIASAIKRARARQAQCARIKALERLPQIDTVIEDAPTRFAFPEPSRIAPPILALDHVDVGYDGVPVLRDVSLIIDMDDRIALLGANGNGKSTLAKLLKRTGGWSRCTVRDLRRRTGRLKVGYFAQHQTDELIAE